MRKNSAAVALGRRSESARKTVGARWEKSGKTVATMKPVAESTPSGNSRSDSSDAALAVLLERLRAATDIAETRLLSDRIERVVFHKQFESA